MFTFVIHVRIKASTLKEAYHKLCTKMGQLAHKDFGWTSTDVVYNDTGELIPPKDVFIVRLRSQNE